MSVQGRVQSKNSKRIHAALKISLIVIASVWSSTPWPTLWNIVGAMVVGPLLFGTVLGFAIAKRLRAKDLATIEAYGRSHPWSFSYPMNAFFLLLMGRVLFRLAGRWDMMSTISIVVLMLLVVRSMLATTDEPDLATNAG